MVNRERQIDALSSWSPQSSAGDSQHYTDSGVSARLSGRGLWDRVAQNRKFCGGAFYSGRLARAFGKRSFGQRLREGRKQAWRLSWRRRSPSRKVPALRGRGGAHSSRVPSSRQNANGLGGGDKLRARGMGRSDSWGLAWGRAEPERRGVSGSGLLDGAWTPLAPGKPRSPEGRGGGGAGGMGAGFEALLTCN